MTSEQILKDWIENRIADKRVEDDLHIDEIDKKYKLPNTWVNGALEMLTAANKQLDHKNFGVFLAMCFISENYEIGFNFKCKADLEAQLSITPPSLYLAHKNSEAWKWVLAGRIVDISDLPKVFETRYNEFKHTDGDFTRVLYLLYQQNM